MLQLTQNRIYLSKEKIFLWLIGIMAFGFFSLPSAFAQDVVINEFLVDPDANQWVELYNKDSSAIDISGWFIDDNGGTQKFTIPSGTSLNPSEFKVFESGYFNLNRSTPDTVRLLNGSSLQDSYSYATGPGANKSYGRSQDGIGDWVVFNSPTKGSSNNNSIAAPTATPTPAPTSLPTPMPTAIKTPTPIPTSKLTSTSKPSPTQSSQISQVSPTPVARTSLTTTIATPKITSGAMPTAILGESTVGSSSPKPQRKKLIEKKISKNPIPKILFGLGVILLSTCGILAFHSYKKVKESNDLS